MNYELSLLRELVGIDTNSVEKKNYVEMSRVLRDRLKEIGAKVSILYAKAPDGKPRPNVIGYIDNGKEQTIGLNAHFDIVPVTGQEWKTDPFKLHISGDKAFGRGTNDDKGNIVAALSGAKDAKSKTNIELLFTCDEEVGSKYGLEWVMKHRRKSVKSNYAVVLDTRKKITIGASGVAFGKIAITGKGTHAGFPFMGKNPITTSLLFLDKTQEFEKIAGKYISKYDGSVGERKIYSRFNITMINSGSKENVIPDKLEARFDMRSIPEVSVNELIGKFKVYFDKLKKESKVDAKLEFTASHDGYVTDPSSKIVKKFVKVTGAKKVYGTFGGDDGTFFHNAGIPLVTYGCGNDTHHEANEYVSIKEMQMLKKELAMLLETF